VPVEGSEQRDEGLLVPYAKDKVKDSPDIDSDEISKETEAELYGYYGLSYSERRSDTSRSTDSSSRMTPPGPTTGRSRHPGLSVRWERAGVRTP